MLDQVQDLLLILIGSSLVSNVVLSQFLGLCPFLGVSKGGDRGGNGNGGYFCHHAFQRCGRGDI